MDFSPVVDAVDFAPLVVSLLALSSLVVAVVVAFRGALWLVSAARGDYEPAELSYEREEFAAVEAWAASSGADDFWDKYARGEAVEGVDFD